MKLDRWIQKLVPTDDRFFGYLDESCANLTEAAETLHRLLLTRNKKEREVLGLRIRELEHKGDMITHKLFSELNSTFVTPIDREDIHKLASSLDDIMDYIDGSVMRFKLYRVSVFPPALAQLSDILTKSVAEVRRGVALLRDVHNTDEMAKTLKKINEYENDADTTFEGAVGALFSGRKNAIEIIKLKEVYVGLETATDKCEDVANVLEGIMIKNA